MVVRFVSSAAVLHAIRADPTRLHLSYFQICIYISILFIAQLQVINKSIIELFEFYLFIRTFGLTISKSAVYKLNKIDITEQLASDPTWNPARLPHLLFPRLGQ